MAKGPLRKIVATASEKRVSDLGIVTYLPREVLECGHVQRPVEDFHGETHAVRRRCRQCAGPSPTGEGE